MSTAVTHTLRTAVDTVKALLSVHPVLCELDEGRRFQLAAHQRVHFLDEGDCLYRSGEKAQSLFFLLRGALQIEYPAPGATRGFVAALLPAPAVLGEAQLLRGAKWTGTGIAVFPSIALALDREMLEGLAHTQPRFTFALYQELAHRFYGAIEQWRRHHHSDPRELLARYLLSFSSLQTMSGIRRNDGVMRIHQASLARATGIRRETVSRWLGKWEKQGYVRLRRGIIEVVDVGGLSNQLRHELPELLLRRPLSKRLQNERARGMKDR
jgi:CRP-like cAMP-binding protein